MTLPGTSMSAPNVTGTLAVLQDYYKDLNGGTMSAAAIKGLVINTANEAGPNDGPDYMFGWGLLNATGAADLITLDDTQGDLICENNLSNGETEEYYYYSDGTEDFNVTICWTDPAGTPPASYLNPTTKMLVNDLDLRVIKISSSATYYPWKLNRDYPALAANSGDNDIDNVETVFKNFPISGYYKVRITHKGNIGSGQDYALIISGMERTTTNTWTGNLDHYWGGAANWSLGHMPTATEDVEIPNVNMPCIVDFSDKTCRDILIHAGATVNIYDQVLTVNRDMTNNGTIGMLQDDAYLNIMHDVVWESGSSLNVTAYSSFIQVWGDWNFEPGANINPTLGFVDFEGTSTSWIRCYSDDCSFNNLRIYKSGGASAQASNLCTEDLVVNALTFITSTGIFNSLSDHDIIMRGNFNYYGTFDFTQSANTGSVIFDGTTQTIHKYSTNDGVFNNVTFSSSTSTTITGGGLTAEGNVTINQGFFNPGVDPVSVGGNWTNNVGTTGFVEGTGRVVFNGPGPGMQWIDSDETFNILENNTVQAIRIGNTVTCNSYDWTSGSISVSGGTFIANDLVQSGIYGNYYALSNSEIYLYQDAGQYVDLFSTDILIYGNGLIKIIGGADESYWCNSAPLDLEISTGGILDFDGPGITIFDSYLLNEDITDGSIKTSGWFACNRTDFNPTDGTIELYGSIDASLSMGAGSNFYNVQINKSASDNIERKSKNKKRTIRDRDGSVIELTRSNTVNVTSELDINGDLQIDAGTFDLDGNTVNVAIDVHNYGELTVDGTLEIGNDFYLYSGSTVDLSGTIHLGTSAGWHGSAIHYSGSTFNQTGGNYYVESIHLYNGSQFNGTDGTTHIYVDGHIVNNNVEIDDPDSYFYNFLVDSGASAALYNCSNNLTAYYTILNGSLMAL
jgi:hypothetical protein